MHITEDGQPNLHSLRLIANSIEPLNLNIKQMGYRLARQLAEALPSRGATQARTVGIQSSLATQRDIESDWAAHWCAELHIPVIYHRKIWELCFVMQALHEAGVIRAGARGLGFGCGTEPLPSYFAARGIDITATDLPPEDAMGKGWLETGQHAAALDGTFMGHLVSRDVFDRHVRQRYVDMNAIPMDIEGYDFCWSVCALEHLGSLGHGLAFVENSLNTLKPGGVAVHTTEFNIRSDGPTIDNWPSVVFQRKHLEDFVAKMKAQGHVVSPFDFSLGDGPLDSFVDLPPYHQDLPEELRTWLGVPAHLKLAYDGLIVTCAGIILKRSA